MEKSYADSVKYFKLAMKHSHIGEEEVYDNAAYCLGYIYFNGLSKEKDRQQYVSAAYYLSLSNLECSRALVLDCVKQGNVILDGKYEEPMNAGGTLVVEKSKWLIRYFVPGPDRKTVSVPDLRYDGYYEYVHDYDIDDYISAWRDNFDLYEAMAGNGLRGDQTTIGKMKMRVSSKNGISMSLRSPLRIRTRSQLEELIADYENTKRKAAEIQANMLKKPVRKLKPREEFDPWLCLEIREPDFPDDKPNVRD